MCLMGDSNVGICGRGGCTGMVALANGVDVVGCASVEGPVISSEVNSGHSLRRSKELVWFCVPMQVHRDRPNEDWMLASLVCLQQFVFVCCGSNVQFT